MPFRLTGCMPDGWSLVAVRTPVADFERRVETYVIDRDDLELYGVDVKVTFAERLRGQIKFDGIEPLISQMTDDVDAARQILA